MTLCCSFVVVFPLIYCSCADNNGREIPVAQKGILDLSEWDFNKKGPVQLMGEWEFYWSQLLTAEDLKNTTDPSTIEYIAATENWEKKAINGKFLPEEGYATYRLRIKHLGNPRRLAILFPEINTAFVAFINGKMLTKSGSVGKSGDTSVPQWMPHVSDFTPDSDEVELLLWISNFHYIRGGFFSPLRLGNFEDIASDFQKTMILDMIVFGSLLIMALYHFCIYLLRRNERTPLYFGLYCFLIALRMFFTSGKYINIFFSGVPWEYLHKVEYLSFSIAVPVFAKFYNSLFKGAINKWFIRFILAAGLCISFLILVTDSSIYSHTGTLFKIITVTGMAYVILSLIVLCVRKNEGAGIFLAGFILLTPAGVNDILHDSRLIVTGYYFHYGLFFFIFSQSFILSLRFLRAFQKIENLTSEIKIKSSQIEERNISLMNTNSELEALKKDLEQKVFDRTATIEKQKSDLEKHKIIMDNQITMAHEIQAALLPKNIPAISNASLHFEYVPIMGVGGDFIDIFYDRSSESLDLFICDVSGHGVPAALLASMVKMSLQSIMSTTSKPSEILMKLQQSLAGKMSGNFITACMSSIDLRLGRMRFANAGHPPIILIKDDGNAEFIQVKGKIIHDMVKHQYREIEIQLHEREKIIFYTDGITESMDKDGVLFGDMKLISLARMNFNATPKEICHEILEHVNTYTLNSELLNDDIAILSFEYFGPSNSVKTHPLS